jgi:hypothetical protein
MPRRPKLAATDLGHALVVARSPLQQRLDAVLQERERLQREIAKKKLACEAAQRELETAQALLARSVQPLYTALFRAVREIHAAFARMLHADHPLSRRDKATLRRVYAQLVDSLPADAEAGTQGDGRERDSGPAPRGDSAGPREQARQDFRNPGPNDTEETHASAAKPSEQNTSWLRSLYRRLIVALHPDKARDPEQIATLTAVMKEVTTAYAHADLAKLLELERRWLAELEPRHAEEDLTARLNRQIAENQELRRQLRSVTQDLKELKMGFPELQSAAPGKRRESPSQQIEEMLKELEREVTQIQNLNKSCQSLLRGELEVDEFVRGRSPNPADEDGLEDWLEAIAQGILDEAHMARPRKRRSR